MLEKLGRSSGALIAVAALLAISACGSDEGGDDATASGAGSSAASAGGSSGDKPRIASFALTLASPYDSAQIKAEEAAAKSMGADITVFDGKLDPTNQVAQCRTALGTGQYNVFLIKAVTGPPVMPCARQAIQQGIKVVAVDDPLGPDYTLKPQVPGLTASILSLPQTNAKALADMTSEACAEKNPCEVAYYFGSTTFTFFTGTRENFKKMVAAKPNIRIVNEANSQFQPAVGTTITRELLSTDPGVDVIASDSDQGVLGAYKALKAAGKDGQVKLIGSGASCLGVEAIKAGQMYGSSALYPKSTGELAVKLGVEALQGKPVDKPELDQAFLTSTGPKVTKANVDGFTCEW